MVFKELNFNSFNFGRCVVDFERYSLILTVSPLGGCGGLERTNFILQFLLWEVWWS